MLIAKKKRLKKYTPTPWGAGCFWVTARLGDAGVVVVVVVVVGVGVVVVGFVVVVVAI